MFRAESMMYQPLVDYFARSGAVVLREVSTPEGRVDIVAAVVDWSAARARQELGCSGGLVRAPLLQSWDALPTAGALALRPWAESLSVSPSTARAVARELQRLGFLEMTADGYTRRAQPPPVLKEIICCEAKLDDWRRGLNQAYGHRFYADRSYLALANRIPRSVDFDLLEQRHVGLLSVADDVTVTQEVEPRAPPRTLTRRLIEERFWVDVILPRLSSVHVRFSSSTRYATA